MPAVKAIKAAMSNSFTNHLVSGYLRRLESLLDNNVVPIMISYLIAALYHIPEFVMKIKRSTYHVRTQNNQTVITTVDNWHHGYGIYFNEWIESLSDFKFTWIFSINKLNKMMYFYLISKICSLGPWDRNGRPCYSFSNDQRIYKYPKDGIIYYKRLPVLDKDLDSKLKFGTGDIVSFILDLPNKTLLCSINGDTPFILRNDVDRDKDIKWKMAMTLADKGDSITLLSAYQHQ